MKKFRTLKKIAAAMAAVLAIQVIPFSAMAVGDEINDTIDHEAIIDKLHADEAENAEAQAIVAEENLASNQEIQIYSITIGTLYKNNSGNAYFDNVELTPVE